MQRRALLKIIRKFHGWMEGDIAYFPSVWLREQFQRHLALAERE